MALTEPRPVVKKSITQPSYLALSWFKFLLQLLKTEVRYLVRGLGDPALFVFILLATILLALAWQAPLDWHFKLGSNTPDFLYIRGFNPPERNQNITFRWSSDESYLRFQGVGRLPTGTLELTMQVGGRAASLGDAHLKVFLGKDGPLLNEVAIGPGLHTYRFNFNSAPSSGQDLVFFLNEPDAFVAPGHDRPLGVVITEAGLTGGMSNNRPVLPPPAYLGMLLVGLIVFYLALFRSGWRSRSAAWLSTIPALGAAWAVAFVRLQFTPVMETLFLTILLSYPLLVLGLRSTCFWLKLRNTDFPAKEARWVGLIFCLAFVVKAAGLNDPAFLTIDHWFRVHQILRFVNEPNLFWQQYYNVTTGQTVTGFQGGSAVLGQWGVSVQLPYSPLFYLVAAPFAFFWPTHDPNLLAAVNLLATWLEVSQVWLLYIICRRAYNSSWSGIAGILAGAIFGFYPLSFLLFSDGGYNSLLANWLSLFFIAILVDGVRPVVFLPQPNTSEYSNLSNSSFKPGAANSTAHSFKQPVWGKWRWIGLILTLSGALLAHTSTLLLLGTFVVLLSIFLLLVKDLRELGRRLAIVSIVSFGLAFLLYYGFYFASFVTQSLPTLFQNLQSKGALGQEQKLLGTPLLTGFWPQLWAHFNLLPFVLTIGVLIILWPFQNRLQVLFNSNQEEPRISKAVYLIWIAWFLTFMLFAALDLKVNLLQKHMLFVAPLLCLGSGFALSLGREFIFRFWTRNDKTSSRITTFLRFSTVAVILLLLGFNFWQGVSLWYERVYYYILPPGSG